MADQPAPTPGATPDPKAPSPAAAPAASPSQATTPPGGISASGAGEKPSAAAAAQPAKPAPGPSAAERLAAAKTKHLGSTGAASAEAQKGQAASGGGAAAASTPGASSSDQSKPAEGTKPATGSTSESAKPEKPPADAWAALADQENQLTEGKRTLKGERDAFTAERTAFDARAARYTKAEELAAKGDHLGALNALGIDMDKANDQYLAGQREKTPEEVAREAARAELDEREQNRKTAEAEAAKTKQTDDQQQFQARLKTWCDGVTAEAAQLNATGAGGFAKQFPMLGKHKVWDGPAGDYRLMNAVDVYQRAVKLELAAAAAERRTAEMPSPRKALEMVEADLAKEFGAPAPAADTKKTTAEDTAPATLSPEGAGSVPLSKTPQAKQGESVFDRLQRAKQKHLRPQA